MGVENSLIILQQKMNDLFHVFEFICMKIYETLVLSKGDWTYHAQKLELTLSKLKEKVIECDI